MKSQVAEKVPDVPLNNIDNDKKENHAPRLLDSMDVLETNGMAWPSIGTQQRFQEDKESNEKRLEKMAGAVKTLLECVGEDVNRDGILYVFINQSKTPMRYAKALMFFTKGYEESVQTVLNDAIFAEDHEEMVIVKNIDVCN